MVRVALALLLTAAVAAAEQRTCGTKLGEAYTPKHLTEKIAILAFTFVRYALTDRP